MDILVKIFTDGAPSEHEAVRKVQEAFNDFTQNSEFDRVVSITTNTAFAMSPSGDTWFVYTLTLVYEPHIVITQPEDIAPVDDPTKELF